MTENLDELWEQAKPLQAPQLPGPSIQPVEQQLAVSPQASEDLDALWEQGTPEEDLEHWAALSKAFGRTVQSLPKEERHRLAKELGGELGLSDRYIEDKFDSLASSWMEAKQDPEQWSKNNPELDAVIRANRALADPILGDAKVSSVVKALRLADAGIVKREAERFGRLGVELGVDVPEGEGGELDFDEAVGTATATRKRRIGEPAQPGRRAKTLAAALEQLAQGNWSAFVGGTLEALLPSRDDIQEFLDVAGMMMAANAGWKTDDSLLLLPPTEDELIRSEKHRAQAAGKAPPDQVSYQDDDRARRGRELSGLRRPEAIWMAYQDARANSAVNALAADWAMKKIDGLVSDGQREDASRLELELERTEPTLLPRDYGQGDFEQAFHDAAELAASQVDVFEGMGKGAVVAYVGAAALVLAATKGKGRKLAHQAGMKAAGLGAKVGGIKSSFHQELGVSVRELRSARTDEGELLDESVIIGTGLIYASAAATIEQVSFSRDLEVLGAAGSLLRRRVVRLAAKDAGFRAAARRMAQAWAGRAGVETLEEMGQESMQILTSYAGRSWQAGALQAADPRGAVEEVLEVGATTLVGSLITGPAFSAAGAPVSVPLGIAGRRREASLAAAVRSANQIQTVSELADSELAKADPEAAAKAVAEATAKTGEEVTEVHLDAEAALRLFQEAQVDPEAVATELFGGDGPALLEEARQTGSKITVPMEVYLTWSKARRDQLAPHLSTRPATMTAAQVQADIKQIEEEATELAGRFEQEDVPAESEAEAGMLAAMERQLAETGIYDKAEARKAMAPLRAFARVQAERFGVEPDVLFEAYRVRVEGPKTQAAETAAAPAAGGEGQVAAQAATLAVEPEAPPTIGGEPAAPAAEPAPPMSPAAPASASPATAAPAQVQAASVAAPATGQTAPTAPSPGIQGAATTVITPQRPQGERARYQVIEADDLIPSHREDNFQARDDYPAGVQEREYHRQPEEQVKVATGAQTLNPALLLADSPTAIDGPPLVTAGDRAIVMGGNGRAMMIKRAFRDPAKAQAYREALAAKAQAFGIDPAAIEGMRAPVLVRVLEDVPSDAPQADLVAAVRRTNESMTQALSPQARAVAEAKTLSPTTVEAIANVLAANPEDTLRSIMAKRPRELVEILRRDGVITNQNQSAWLRGHELTDEAKDRLEGMFLGRVVGSGDRMAQTPKSILAKLERIAPSLLRVQGINPAADATTLVQQALDVLNEANARGVPLEILTAQTSLIPGEGTYDPEAVRMADLLQRSRPLELAARFRGWANLAAFDPNQVQMFAANPTAAETRGALLSDTLVMRQNQDALVLYQAQREAAPEAAAKESAQASEQTRTPEFKGWFGDWEAAAHREFLDGEPVASLESNPFEPDGSPLAPKVAKWYADSGNSIVEAPGIGSVALDKRAVGRSAGHGLGRDKVAAFALVPDVLRSGRIVAREPMRGATDGGQVFFVAAPVMLDGKAMVAVVQVKSDSNASRMYVHEVVLREKLQRPAFESGARAAEAGMRSAAGTGAIRNVLQQVYSVNPATVSKVVDAEGRPLVVYHGTRGDFDAFDGAQTGEATGAKSTVLGFFFTSEPGKGEARASARGAEVWAAGSDGRFSGGSNIMPVFLDIKNPKRLGYSDIGPAHLIDGEAPRLREVAEAAGHDGFVFEDGGETWYIAFRPEQIKSATGNRGTFDPSDPSILRQAAPKGREPRGFMERRGNDFRIVLGKKADLSTFLHETGHVFLEILGDLAQRPDAPQQVREDYQRLLAWFGVADRSELGTEHHEQFARGFEAYLREGKAPSDDLVGAFDSFARWLKRIYRSVRGLNVELSDEVRGVFDRMVATDEEIARARDESGQTIEMFPDREAAKMSEKEWADYQKLRGEPFKASERGARRKALQETLREKTKQWKEERAKLRKEAEEAYGKTPAYRAKQALAGKMVDAEGNLLTEGAPVRLDRAAVAEAVGEQRARRFLTVEEDGLHPDELAGMYGFASGAEMLQAIDELPSRRAWAREMADAQMEERHPGLMQDRERLREEIHQLARQGGLLKLILFERDVLRRLSGKQDKGPSAEVIERAAQMILERRTVGKLRPGMVLHQERMAAHNAAMAVKKGEFAKAEKEKERQAINAALYRRMMEARDEMKRAEKDLRGRTKKAYRAELGKASEDYLTVHDAILAAARITETEVDTAEALEALDRAARLAEGDANPFAFDVDVIRRLLLSPRDWAKLSLPEARAVRDAIINIREVARSANEVVLDGKRVQMADVRAQLAKDAEALPDFGKAPASRQQVGKLRKGFDFAVGLHGQVMQPERLMESLGAVGKMVWRRFKEASRERNRLIREVLDPINALWEKMPSATKKKLWKPIAELDQTLPLPEDVNLAGPRDRMHLIMIAFNMGNESNKQRLLRSLGWTEEQVMGVLNEHLTAEEWQWIQTIFDTMDQKLWPLVAEKEKRKTGLPPDKIQASALVTKHGTFRGGYFPAAYDPRASRGDVGLRQAEDTIASLFGPAHIRPATRKSHTQERAKDYSNVIFLDWSVVTSHFEQVINDIAFDEFVRDAARIFLDPEVKQLLDRRLGAHRQIEPREWLRFVANSWAADAASANNLWAKVVGAFKGRGLIGALGLSATVAMSDFANPLVAMAVGRKRGGTSFLFGVPAYLAALPGVGRAAGMRQMALRKSPELRSRIEAYSNERRLTYLRNIGRKRGKLTATMESVVNGAWFFQEQMDKMTSTQLWLARYWEEKARGKSEAEAVELADEVVRDHTMGPDRAEQSRLLRDPGAVGAIMAFQGYANVLYNVGAGLGGNVVRTVIAARRGEASYGRIPLEVVAVAARIQAVIFFGNVVGELFSGRGPDDDEEWDEWALRKQLGGHVYPIPIVGTDLEAAVQSAFRGKRMPTSGRSLGLSYFFDQFQNIGRMANEDLEDEQRAWAAIELMLSASGQPVVQPKRTLGYIQQLLNDEADPDNIFDILSGLSYGKRENQPANPFSAVSDAIEGR